MATLFALLLTLFTQVAWVQPSLSYLVNTQAPIHVTYNAGAVYECLFFHAEHETAIVAGEEVPYEPALCNFLDPTSTSFDEDWYMIRPNGEEWTIVAHILYMGDDGEAHAYPSNTIRVIH